MKKSTFGAYLVALLLGILWLRPAAGHAQTTYLTPVTGNTTVTTCSGTVYDDGGASGTYSAYATGGITIMPATAGSKVRLDFTEFYTESGYDNLYIYDGSSSSATLIGSYTGTTSPGTVYGTSSSGALTLVFTTDGSVQYTGFAATISCATSVPLPDLTVQGASVSPVIAVAGNAMTATSQIYNLSGGTANSSNVGYYLSTDNTFSSNDILLGGTTGGSLAVGQSSSRYGNFTIPTGTTPGSYYVLFFADYQNYVNESNENNNVTSVSITVQAASPDLLIQNATVTPAATQAGNAISFSCYIYNQGNATASSSSVGFYFSSDATLDASDALLTAQYGTSLTANNYSQRSSTAAVPNNTAAGNYYILFVADYQSQVTESNENNNVAAVAITVQGPGPDLTVTQQSLYSTYLSAGTSTTAYATISNAGNQTASSSTLGFYLSTNTTFDASDIAIGSSTGTSLTAGASSSRTATITVPANTAAGYYYVLYVADPSNAVTEINETNNVVYTYVTVYAPSIDLTVYSANLSAYQSSPGGTLTTSGYEYNQGNTAAGAHRLGYYLSTNTTLDAGDIVVGNSAIASVASGYYTQFSGSLTLPSGTATGNYYILFVADDLNQIAETNESNNVYYVSLQVVAPGIDLTTSSPYLSLSQTTAGSSVSASCYLNNLGTTSASAATTGFYLSTNTTFDANDIQLGSAAAVTLTAGGSVTRSATLTIPTGTASGYYYVLFVADPNNTTAETNENNNVTYLSLQVVAPSIDLYTYPGYSYTSSSYLTAGTSTSATSYVINQGNATASPVTVGYYLSTNATLDASDILIGNTSIASMAGGGYNYIYGTANIPANTATGYYYILFVADYLNQLVETNKNNNVASYSVQITGISPDLLPTQSNLSTATVSAGSSLTAGSYVYNQGNSTASSSNLGYYLSTNTVFDASDVLLATSTNGALGSQQSAYLSANLTIPSATAAGTYYILFFADPTNLVAESNEQNNVAYVALTVTAPFTGTVVPTTGSATITTCSATIYDNGGFGNYANNSTGSLTINPGTANSAVRLTFSAFNTEFGSDYLAIYDGTSTNSPLLGTYTGSTVPPAMQATNTDGALTLRFFSDASTNSSGFVCSASCVQFTATMPQQTAGYDVSVLPNPVAGGQAVRVQLSGAGQLLTATATLLNTLGQKVATSTLALTPARVNTLELPTTGLASGVYVLRLTGNGLNAVQRVVVE